MGTHYVAETMHQLDLAAFAYKAAEEIQRLLHSQTYQKICLCYTGMSGIALATSVCMALRPHAIVPKMFYVRKDTEKSHGRKNEMTDRELPMQTLFIFIDDFISKGDTVNRVFEAIWDEYPDSKHFHIFLVTNCFGKEGEHICLTKQWNGVPVWASR